MPVSTWQGMRYILCVVPMGAKPLVEKVAAQHKLRLADGTPRAITLKGFDSFPVSGDNAFTLERAGPNMAGVAVWGQPGGRLEEDLQCQAIINDFKQRTGQG